MTKSDVIRLVLNKLIELYDIDTSSIWPDDRLAEIGIDPEMTRRVLRSCFIELDLNEYDGISGNTPQPETVRGIVDVVYSKARGGADRQAA